MVDPSTLPISSARSYYVVRASSGMRFVLEKVLRVTILSRILFFSATPDVG